MSDFSPDDAAYLTADRHKNKHNSVSSDGGERKRSSSKKQPKGILKNSNPNATYHEEGSLKSNSGRNKRVEELMEYERPKTSSSGHGHSHSHKKHRRDSLKDDSESSGASSPRTSSSDSRHHSSSSKKHSHSKRNGDHYHECNGSSSRSSSSSKEHREQKSLERKSHKHHNSSDGGERSSKKRSSDHHEQRHRQTSDSDTLESTKSNTSGTKQHRERKSSKHRHSEHSEEKSSHSNKEGSSSRHHKHNHSSNGGTFTKEEGRKIVRDGHLMMDEEVDLTTSFKSKNHKKDKSKHQNGDSLSRDYPTRESVDLDNLEDIYDRPKVPPVRYIPPGEKQTQKEKLYQEHNDDFSYRDLDSAILSKASSIDDGIDDPNDSDDSPLYKTVVKTSKKNGGGVKSNDKKSSRNNFDSHEEEFIDSLQAIDVIPKPGNGGFYENVGFGSAKMDKNDNAFTTSTYVEEDINGDDKFITVGEALSNTSSISKSQSKNGKEKLKDQNNEFGSYSPETISRANKVEPEAPQPLYDVPRSNPRRVSPTSLLQSASETLANAIPSDFTAEAVYVNDGYANDLVSSMINPANEDQLDFDQYDIPRSNKNLSDLIPQDYDVPKNRDSLSTIEEEHQEYDIPKPLLDSYLIEKKYDIGLNRAENTHEVGNEVENPVVSTMQKIEEQNEPILNDPFEANLYENQNEIFQNSSNENIYANDGVSVDSVGGENTNLCNSHR